MEWSSLFQEIPYPGSQDFRHYSLEFRRRPPPSLGPPLLFHLPPGLKKVGGVEGEPELFEFSGPQGVEADRMDQLNVPHSILDQLPGNTRTVKDIPRKISKDRVDLRSQNLMGLVSKSIVKVTRRQPTGDLDLGFAPGLGPVAHELRHPGHMLTPLFSRVGPGREFPFCRIPEHRVHSRLGSLWMGFQQSLFREYVVVYETGPATKSR